MHVGVLAEHNCGGFMTKSCNYFVQQAQLAVAYLHDLESHSYVPFYPSESGAPLATTRAREEFYKPRGFLQIKDVQDVISWKVSKFQCLNYLDKK